MTMSKSRKKAQPCELPPAEQLARSPFRVEHISPVAGGPTRLRRLDATEIDRLLYAGLIEPEDHSVLAAFGMKLERSGLSFCPKAGFGPRSTAGGGSFISDSAFLMARKVEDEMRALKTSLTDRDRNMVIDALTSDKRVPPGREPVMTQAAIALRPFY